MKTFGHRATEALFALFDKAKLSGKPGALARENIAGDMAELLDELAAKYRLEKKSKTPAQRTGDMDEIWLAELEANPVYKGVDVRRELGKCQVWCSNNNAKATRKRFINWLNRDRPLAINGQGQSSFPKAKRGDPYSEPADWRTRIMMLPYDKDRLREMAGGNWGDVSINVREELVR